MNLLERMDFYHVPGVSMAIIRDGEISSTAAVGVLEKGENRKVTTDSIFNACSISKFSSAMLALKLVDEGILDLDEEVDSRLKSWEVPENHWTHSKKVTLRRLLCHQSGFVDPEESFGPISKDFGLPENVDLLLGDTPYCPEPIAPTYEPGSAFQYADAGYCVIQQLIEEVTGKRFEQMIQEKVFTPLKMNNSVFLSSSSHEVNGRLASGHNQHGNCIAEKQPVYSCPASAGLWSTPTDLAKMFTELHHTFLGSGKIHYSREMIQEMISPQGCSQWTGLGVFLDSTGKEIEISSLGWGIGFQCLLVGFPHLGNGAVVMTNADLGVHQLKGLIGEIIRSIDLSGGDS